MKMDSMASGELLTRPAQKGDRVPLAIRVTSLGRVLDESRALQLGVLAGITFMAAVMRFYRLGDWSYWIDEIATIDRIQGGVQQMFSFPPVGISFLLTHAAVSIYGLTEWSARLAPATIGTLAIPIAYFPLRAMFNARTALIAVLLLAISPWHLFWSQSARFYTTLLLFYSLAMFALFFGLERDRLGYILLSLVFFALAARERMMSLLFIPVVVVYLACVYWLPFEKPKGLRARNLIPLIALALLGLAFVIYEVIQSSQTGVGLIRNELNWFFDKPIDDPARLLIFALLGIGIPLAILAVLSGSYLALEKNRAGLYLLIGAVLPLVLIILANPFMFTKDRYIFMTLFCWIGLAAAGIDRLLSILPNRASLLAWGVFLVLVAQAATAHLLYYTVDHGDRYDWRGAFQIVQGQMNPDDLLVTTRPEIAAYYFEGEVNDYVGLKPETIAAPGRRVWFVVDSERVWNNRQMKQWLFDHAVMVDFQYLRVPEELNLRIYRADPVQ